MRKAKSMNIWNMKKWKCTNTKSTKCMNMQKNTNTRLMNLSIVNTSIRMQNITK
ncbi:hypothetical protein J2747_002305 [Thermococcus stetteri]|nr:hypothetical protein [Thermococcus stetteri]